MWNPISSDRGLVLLSFSGIDGAGKSTQITNLCARLRNADLRVRVFTFWDDVAMLGRGRELLSHVAFKGDKGVGAPGRPVNRRDKNVKAWYLTWARFALYFLDALSLTFSIARVSKATADVIVCDRYIYDELANLSLNRQLTRAYARFLLRCVPKPDIAFLLDADPVQAVQRKPEYPLEFLHTNRASYLTMSELAGMTVIGPLPVNEVERSVTQQTLGKLPLRDVERFLAVGHPASS
jgi:thymidylate kinase